MKQATIRVPVVVTINVPNTWGARKIKRMLAGGAIINKDGPRTLRPSQVTSIVVDAELAMADISISDQAE